MRLGLIVDNLELSAWQAEALSQIAGDAEFIVLSCTNSGRRIQPIKHALYYALRLWSFDKALIGNRPIPANLRVSESVEFAAEPDGVWQKLPPELIQKISDARLTAIIKFGMGLLRVPGDLHCPVLSYHHGDPREFRGRPAAFYEVLSGRTTVGQVVQILSNKLDAGKVVAFGETKVHPHSYRATLQEAYRCSPLLLPQALRNASSGVTLAIDSKGQNYRLPSNSTVLRFLGKTISARVRRLIYGAFFEKRWQIATAPGGVGPMALCARLPDPSDWKHVDCPSEYRFIADPFAHPATQAVLAEGLRRSDLQGEIVSLKSGQQTVMCSGAGHFSYPATICIDDSCYLVPEISEWSAPRIFRLNLNSAEAVGELQVEGSPKLIDPTLHKAADGNIYLFANDADAGFGVLKLWVSRGLFERFTLHPSSPISISPAGSRMGGAIWELDGRLYRIGQDGRCQYGDGLILFAICELNEQSYREEIFDTLRFNSVRGPHTLNAQDGQFLFDFYEERFTPLAGVERLRSRLTKKRARRRMAQLQR